MHTNQKTTKNKHWENDTKVRVRPNSNAYIASSSKSRCRQAEPFNSTPLFWKKQLGVARYFSLRGRHQNGLTL